MYASEQVARKGVWLKDNNSENPQWFYSAVPEQFNPVTHDRSEIPEHWKTLPGKILRTLGEESYVLPVKEE